MSQILFANNAGTTLAGAISNTATAATLATGTGALFPNPAAGQVYTMTFTDAATGLLNEIVSVTARSGDVITIVRAQEGTTALGWNAGDLANNRLTAGQMAAMEQSVSANNYAVDTGAANAYVIALPSGQTTNVPGLPIRFLAANANTGASTLNIGGGAVALVRPRSTFGIFYPLENQDIIAQNVYTAIYNADEDAYIVQELMVASLMGMITINATVSNGSVATEICSRGGGSVNIFITDFPTSDNYYQAQVEWNTNIGVVVSNPQVSGTITTGAVTFSLASGVLKVSCTNAWVTNPNVRGTTIGAN